VFILPLNDDRYVGRAPHVIISLTIVNGLVLAATYLLASSQSVFSRYGFIPAQPHILTMFFVSLPSRWHLPLSREHVLFVDVWVSHRKHFRTLAICSGLSIVRMRCDWTPLSFQPDVHHAVWGRPVLFQGLWVVISYSSRSRGSTLRFFSGDFTSRPSQLTHAEL
jgi:hypothetical protein